MIMPLPLAANSPLPPHHSRQSHPSRLAAYVVRRRVRITLLIVAIVVVHDFLTAVRPHEVLTLRDPVTTIGLTLVAVGLALRSWAAGVLHKDRELTTTGPYAVTRNPLYAGSLLLVIGFAALIGNPWDFIAILAPLSLVYYLQILHEEQVLVARFGQSWHQYAGRVGRIIPRRLPRNQLLLRTWRLRDWCGSREYRALVATAAGVAALHFWRVWSL